jgi:hypothetical protein
LNSVFPVNIETQTTAAMNTLERISADAPRTISGADVDNNDEGTTGFNMALLSFPDDE